MSTVDSFGSPSGSSRGSSVRGTPRRNINGSLRMCSGCHEHKSRELFPRRQWETKNRRCYSCFANTVPFSYHPPTRQDLAIDVSVVSRDNESEDTSLPTAGYTITTKAQSMPPTQLHTPLRNANRGNCISEEQSYQSPTVSSLENMQSPSPIVAEQSHALATEVSETLIDVSSLRKINNSVEKEEPTPEEVVREGDRGSAERHDGPPPDDEIAEPAASLDLDIGDLARSWTSPMTVESTEELQVPLQALDPPESSEASNSTNNRCCSCRGFLMLFASPILDDTGSIQSIVPGMITLFLVGSLIGVVSNKNSSLPTPWYQYMSAMIGYIYFICWSVSFYPQVISNYKRKTTHGLSADFCALNVIGFACYTAYNSCIFWSPVIRELYRKRYGSDPTVQSNDVAFAIHALILSSITLAQIAYYRGSERPSKIIMTVIVLILLFCAGYPVLVYYEMFSWLDYIYALSFVKIGISLIKYMPQVVLNYRRKSTVGWSIWNILLDFTGGILSDTQLVLDCADMNDFSGITGNLAKFGLGFVSILFDIIFMIQHYILYHDGRRVHGEPGRPETEPLLPEGNVEEETEQDLV